MKKELLFLTILSLFTLTIYAQGIEVPETNQPLVTKRTASWCTNCGSWGWTLFNDLYSDNTANALVIAAHHSGNYSNPAATGIVNNLGGFGQPTFFFNNQNQNASSSNIAAKRSEIKDQVENQNGQAPVAQTGIKAEVDDTYTIFVETNTHFFQETEGNHYLGIYLIEKSFVGFQASAGNNAVHKNVLRVAADGEALGTQFAFGTIESGSEFAGNFMITQSMIEASGVENLDGLYTGDFLIASIIWKLNPADNSYEVVNTNKVEIGVLTSTNDLLSVNSFKAYPTVSTFATTLELDVQETLSNTQIVLMDQTGRVLDNIYTGVITSGLHLFTIERNQLAAGSYYVRLLTNEGSSTKSIIFR